MGQQTHDARRGCVKWSYIRRGWFSGSLSLKIGQQSIAMQRLRMYADTSNGDQTRRKKREILSRKP